VFEPVSTLAVDNGTRRWASLLGVGFVAAYVGGLGFAMDHATYSIWGTMLLVPALFLISFPMLMSAARWNADPWFAKMLPWAFALKLTSSVIPYIIGNSVYNGTVDAHYYDTRGQHLAHLWWHGNFATPSHKLIGTGFIVLVTAAIYYVIGPNFFGAYMVYAWMGFWGFYLMFKALRIALPSFDHRRYAKFLFFLPSLVFWSSNLGKEGWMILCIGISALGTAKLLRHERGAFILLAIGGTGTLMVRPHITVLMLAGVSIGFLLRRRGEKASPLTPIYTFFGILVLFIGGAVVLSQAKHFFGVSAVDSSSVNHVIDKASGNTQAGSSEFVPARVHSPADLPRALLTVLFRPFPWEAHNAQSLAAAGENAFLLVLLVFSGSRLAKVPRLLLREPYLGFCLVYLLLFVFAFSGFANFGLLVRERIQVIPFVLVFLCAPKPLPGGGTVSAATPTRSALLIR
jgi:hypothetical protein